MSKWREVLQGVRSVWAIPGAPSLLCLSLLARSVNIPLGALLTVIAYEISGSWITAAVSGGITAAAAALSFWWSGKAIDIWGPRRVLLWMAPGSLLPLLFLADPGDGLLLLFSLLVGLLRPPSGTSVRTAWQHIAPERRLQAYGLDASLAPVAGALGALGGGFLLAVGGLPGLVLSLVLLTLLSTLLLAAHRTSRATGHKKISEEGAPLGKGVWVAVLLVGLSWGGLVGLELLVGDLWGPEMLLLVTALGGFAVAGGALLGGLGGDPSGRQNLQRSSQLAAGALLLLVPALFFFPPLVFPLVIIFGLARGIISAAGSTYLSVVSPPERRSEALALYGSGVLLGQATYRPLAGALLLVAPALILLLPAVLFLGIGRALGQREKKGV